MPEGDGSPLPVRMLNEYAYCPRLFHLMHVDGRWAENQYTVEGTAVHRRVDRIDHVLPDPEGDPTSGGNGETTGDSGSDEPPRVSRSVSLSSTVLGLTAKLDLVSTAGDEAVPVETKRGRVPRNSRRSWEPERVQLMAQGLLLREHGYRCDHGVLYFAASRTRVDVPFDEELESRTLALLAEAHAATQATTLPDPLEDSPKCVGCSLSGICLPDETLTLRALGQIEDRGADRTSQAGGSKAEGPTSMRRLYPSREHALPFYVQEQGARIGKRGKVLIVTKEGEEVGRARLKDVSQVVVLGNVSLTTQAIHMLCEASVPIVYLSTGHWFYGMTQGSGLRNAFDRAAQFEVASDEKRCLAFAKTIVAAKGANQRTLLRRNATPRPADALTSMSTLLGKVEHAGSADTLLGLEGGIAALYFGSFSLALRPRDFEAEWDFDRRNRRPPQDPINALLSFGYAVLARECTVALQAEGLDPWWGFYHRPRHGRPALALDLMEEFRPLIVDSALLTAVNTGMVTRRSFTRSKAGCMLTDSGRKGYLRAFEARADQLVTHPLFGYRCSWRSVIRMQARLLARWVRGDVPSYLPMRTR